MNNSASQQVGNKINNGLFFLGIFAFLWSPFSTLAEASCQYTPQEKSLQIGWTAFKTTQKLGVHGKFKHSKNQKSLKKSYESLTKLLDSAQIEVQLLSSDSGDPGRDQTLKQKFFSKLAGKGLTQASLTVEQENEDHTGNAILHLSFNGKKKDVPVTFALDHSNVLTVKGTLDLIDFGADAALNSLNKACFDLHKGPDGVSKTWSNVEFFASATVQSACTP